MNETSKFFPQSLARTLIVALALGGATLATQPAWAQDAAPGFSGSLPPVTQLFEREKNKVVSIQTELAPNTGSQMFQFFGGPQGRPQSGMGSGFVVDPSGYIVTNNHVVDGATVIKVRMQTGESYDAQLVGTDPSIDIALLKVETKKPLPAVTIGTSSKLDVGEWVVAIGSPFGLDYTVTTGIVSAKGRNLGAGPYDDFIQTDASINPGNSGGPLFNLRGEVVGVNTAIIRDGQGIGFAVPIDIVKNVIPQLRTTGYVVRGFIGTGIQDLDAELAESFGLPTPSGVLVSSIEDSGPAARAGLQPGDVIVEFAGRDTPATHDLLLAVAETKPGSGAAVRYIRDGKMRTASVTVAERPGTQRRRTVPVKAPQRSDDVRLGVAIRQVDQRVAAAMGLSEARGVVVTEVAAGSPAAKKLRPGDVILEANGKPVNDKPRLDSILATTKTGDIVRLKIVRVGAVNFVAVRLR